MTSVKTFADEVREIAALQKARNEARAPLEARERAAEFPPSGCHDCGAAEQAHADGTENHLGCREYVTPTDDQTLTRMLARRYGSAADAQDTNTEK